ncbi:hypothetical protein, partial [Methylobacterium sp. SI9]|uniref:hypothetical protein n=1 Tax=Methylobacterium guangdongense TaxID=3138811 RepID=UPI00313B6D67
MQEVPVMPSDGVFSISERCREKHRACENDIQRNEQGKVAPAGSSALSVLASLRTAKLYGLTSGGMEDPLAQKIELRAAVHAPL